MSGVQIQAVGVDRVQIHVRQMGPKVQRALVLGITRETIDLVGVVKDEKLSGQVLGQRTRRLRNSIHQTVNQNATRVAGTVGTDVIYGRFWEMGFVGTEQVRAHSRTINQAFGMPITARTILVAAHARQVNVAPRSFLRSTLGERQAGIVSRVGADVERASAS
jgi:hypothetical protein